MLTDYYLTMNQARKDKDWKLIESTTAAMDDLSREAGKQAAEEKDPLNQIAFYRIAATAAWQANSTKVTEYADNGSNICKDKYFNKAPRDCGMLLVIPYLASVDNRQTTFNDYQRRINDPNAEKPSMEDLSKLFNEWAQLLSGLLDQREAINNSAAHPEMKKAVDARALKILCTHLFLTKGLMVRLSSQDLSNDEVRAATNRISELKNKMIGMGISVSCP